MELMAEDEVDVLFIQRDPDIAELYRHKLQLDGYRVTIVRSVAKWLDGQASTRPDIVYLEISPADAETVAAFTALRQDARMRNVPAVLLSSAGEATLRERGITLGSLDYVVTPPAAISLWTLAEGVFATQPGSGKPA